MNCSALDVPSFARTPRLPRMRSQRIVHVVQTEESNDVSVVTMSEGGHTEETHETVDFTFNDKDKEEVILSRNFDDGSSDQSPGNSIVFALDFRDGAVQPLTWYEDECHEEGTRSRKGSLFSDDEFEPIRMKLPKRTPLPLCLSDYEDELRGYDEPPPVVLDDSSHSGLNENSSLDHSPTLYKHGRTPGTSASSSSLFSDASCSSSSSATYVDHFTNPKSGGRTFCAFDKDDGGQAPATLIDVVTPDSVTGTRGLVDLRLYGYDFDWSRFSGRSENAHDLSPEDSAELEVFLSKGPSTFATPYRPKLSPNKGGFEKKFLRAFKFVK